MTKFEMNYRKTDMRAFFNDIIKKNMMKSLILMYFIIGVAIFAVFLGASFIINDGTVSLSLPFIFLAVFIVIAFISIERKIRNEPEKMYRDFKSAYDDGTITSIFIKDRIYIENSAENGKSSDYILYSNLEKAVESDNYFYIFIDDSVAQILKKSSIVEGSVENVRKYLTTSLGDRYENITIQRRN